MDNNGMKSAADGAMHKCRPDRASRGCLSGRRNFCLTRRHLGDFYLNAKLDLTQDAVKPGLARGIFQGGRGRAQPGEGRWRERPAQEPDLELVERVEGNPAALDGAAPPLDRVIDPRYPL